MTFRDGARPWWGRRHSISFEAMEERRLPSTATPIHAAIINPELSRPLAPGAVAHQGQKPTTFRSGLALVSSQDVRHVGAKYVKLSFSHDTLQVGKAYVRAALKGDGEGLKHLGKTVKVQSIGKRFESLSRSSSVKQVGKQFESFGKWLAHLFK